VIVTVDRAVAAPPAELGSSLKAERDRPRRDGRRHATSDCRGSKLYPSFAGPIILLASAVIVAFRPGRWTPYVALLVPLVLGLGAIIAAVMSGEFIVQLTDTSRAGIVLGSLMHVIGLIAAVAGGAGMVRRRG
jgi:hypothetical protein